MRALVDRAIEQRVDAVVLTGDLADADNKLFEAYGILERQLRRLAGAGVPVYLVAGNHDHDVAGRLADALGAETGGITLLGRGQTWETATLQRDGVDVLRLVGWSFAGPHHDQDPLVGFPALPADLPAATPRRPGGTRRRLSAGAREAPRIPALAILADRPGRGVRRRRPERDRARSH